jgi:hypothetical protein
LESVEKGPPIAHVLDSSEPDGCIVSCGVYRFQSLARLLFCDQVFAGVLEKRQGMAEQTSERNQTNHQNDRSDHSLEKSKAVLQRSKLNLGVPGPGHWFHSLTPAFHARYQPFTRPVDPKSETARLEGRLFGSAM